MGSSRGAVGALAFVILLVTSVGVSGLAVPATATSGNDTGTPSAASATATPTPDGSGTAPDGAEADTSMDDASEPAVTDVSAADVSTDSSTSEAAASDSSGDAETTFVVQQGGETYTVTPLGDGTETVESFYGYGVDSAYSSAGTTDLQANQVSNLFVYEGSEGYSLVFLHDAYGTAPRGSTASVTVTGLPDSATWPVEDDAYQGRDDVFDHAGDRSEIHWKWAPDRTDGAAVRGIGAADGPVTIAPGFNEDAEAWGEWPYSGDADNRTESWRLLGADGSTVTTLALDEDVSVTRGEAGEDDSTNSDDSEDDGTDDADETEGPADDEPPTASVHVPDQAVVGEQVTFQATNVADESGLRHVCWLVDGNEGPDGTTMTHSFEEPGTHTVTLVLVDEARNSKEITRELVVVPSADDGTDATSPTDSTSSTDSAASSDDEASEAADGLGASDWHRSDEVSANWPPTRGPSLSVTNVTVADDGGAGESTAIRVTVANDGDATETKRFTATADGDAVGSTIVTVSAGGSYTKTFTVADDTADADVIRVGNESAGQSVADDEAAAEPEDVDRSDDEAAGAIAPAAIDAPTDTATATDQPAPGDSSASDDDGGAFAVIWSFFAGIVGFTLRYGRN